MRHIKPQALHCYRLYIFFFQNFRPPALPEIMLCIYKLQHEKLELTYIVIVLLRWARRLRNLSNIYSKSIRYQSIEKNRNRSASLFILLHKDRKWLVAICSNDNWAVDTVDVDTKQVFHLKQRSKADAAGEPCEGVLVETKGCGKEPLKLRTIWNSCLSAYTCLPCDLCVCCAWQASLCLFHWSCHVRDPII